MNPTQSITSQIGSKIKDLSDLRLFGDYEIKHLQEEILNFYPTDPIISFKGLFIPAPHIGNGYIAGHYLLMSIRSFLQLEGTGRTYKIHFYLLNSPEKDPVTEKIGNEMKIISHPARSIEELFVSMKRPSSRVAMGIDGMIYITLNCLLALLRGVVYLPVYLKDQDRFTKFLVRYRDEDVESEEIEFPKLTQDFDQIYFKTYYPNDYLKYKYPMRFEKPRRTKCVGCAALCSIEKLLQNAGICNRCNDRVKFLNEKKEEKEEKKEKKEKKDWILLPGKAVYGVASPPAQINLSELLTRLLCDRIEVKSIWNSEIKCEIYFQSDLTLTEFTSRVKSICGNLVSVWLVPAYVVSSS